MLSVEPSSVEVAIEVEVDTSIDTSALELDSESEDVIPGGVAELVLIEGDADEDNDAIVISVEASEEMLVMVDDSD